MRSVGGAGNMLNRWENRLLRPQQNMPHFLPIAKLFLLDTLVGHLLSTPLARGLAAWCGC